MKAKVYICDSTGKSSKENDAVCVADIRNLFENFIRHMSSGNKVASEFHCRVVEFDSTKEDTENTVYVSSESVYPKSVSEYGRFGGEGD